MNAGIIPSTNRKVSRGILVMLRLYVGVVFTLTGWSKLTGGFNIVENLGFSTQRSHEFYKPFLENFVLANPDLFNILIPYGEFLAGVALILGLLTRLASAGVMLMTLNFMLLKGAYFWQNGNDAAFFFIALALILGAAGRMLGVDVVLANKSSKGWLW